MIKVPPPGMTFSRELMPQLGHINDFLRNLKKAKVSFKKETVSPRNLKSTQSEYDLNKVAFIMQDPKKSNSAVVASNDGYILDGHHRWLAAYNLNQKLDIIRVDLPILELIRLAKTFENTTYKSVSNLSECVKNTIRMTVKDKIYK